MRQDLAGQMGVRDAVTRVPETVHDTAVFRRAEERREPGRGADRPPPGVGKRKVAQRREVAAEAGAELGLVFFGVVAIDPRAVSGGVRRLARPPEDPVFT